MAATNCETHQRAVGVLLIPWMPASVRYRWYEELYPDGSSVLQLVLQCILAAQSIAEVVLVVANRSEAERLNRALLTVTLDHVSAVSVLDVPQYPITLRVGSLARIIPAADSFVICDPGVVLCPPRVLDNALNGSRSYGSDVTTVEGLPVGGSFVVLARGAVHNLEALPSPAFTSNAAAAITFICKELHRLHGAGTLRMRTILARTDRPLSGPSGLYEVHFQFRPDVTLVVQAIKTATAQRSDDLYGPLELYQGLKRESFIKMFQGLKQNSLTIQSRPITTAERPRILFISNRSAFSGPEQALCHLAGAIDKAQFDLHALIALDGTFSSRLRRAGVAVHCAERDFGKDRLESVACVVERLATVQPDLIHINSPVGAPTVYAASILGIPIIQHVRVASVETYRHELEAAHAIVAISDYVKEQLKTSRFATNRVCVVPSGVDLAWYDTFQTSQQACKEALGLAASDVVLVAIARFDPAKRLDVLIRAFSLIRKRLPDLKLVCVGELGIFGEVWRDFADYTKREGLGECVKCLGFQEDIRPVLRAADVFTLCSEHEALGLSVVEAMTMGVPVVTSRSGGLQELVQDGVTGRNVAVGDCHALADATYAILTDQEFASIVTREARRVIETRFNVKDHAKSIMELYGQVLASEKALLSTSTTLSDSRLRSGMRD